MAWPTIRTSIEITGKQTSVIANWNAIKTEVLVKTVYEPLEKSVVAG